MITIFTPTYNRAYSLPGLYQSLCNQTSKNFEWLIVDDGSSDNTEDLIKGYISENIISIRYLKQGNGGKHRAINNGVRHAKGDLFFIVDSDDYLTSDAVQWIESEYHDIKSNSKYAGLSGIMTDKNGRKAGGGEFFETMNCNAIDIRNKYHITGDLSEVFKTSVLKEIPFPEIEGEKFCPEALVWNRIATKYILRYVYKGIYVCEYLPDGLTAKIVKIRMDSPVASCIYYSEYIQANVPLTEKIKTGINYWRFYFCKSPHQKPGISFKWIFTLPFGWLMHLKDLYTTRK